MFKTKPNKYTEICGWYGMIALISAYGLASYGVIGAQSLEFQLLNITGSIGMMIVALSKGVTQAVVLNIIWMGLGLVAIAQIMWALS
jgi:hypothetical protein